jgi:hypothetical protein
MKFIYLCGLTFKIIRYQVKKKQLQIYFQGYLLCINGGIFKSLESILVSTIGSILRLK